jgi:branched-subunit amino acid ABC-type transport system permease component
MLELFDIPLQVVFGQLLLGLINGAFYATLSLGLALIFGMLNIVNFAHGAQYMMGAFTAWLLLNYLGLNYWVALVLAPILVAFIGALIERTMLRRLYHLDHLYGFMLTFGLSLLIEGAFRGGFGVSGQPYAIPPSLTGGFDLGFMFLPTYRAWVIAASIVACLGTWWLIEGTRLGSCLRAATENPILVRSFGINVPRLVTVTYMLGVGLAGLAGVLAAPIYQVSSIMGSNIIPVVFAVIVIGGLGSILGSIVTGFLVGVTEGIAKVFYPEASNTVAFALMVVILLIRPQGLFGKRT